MLDGLVVVLVGASYVGPRCSGGLANASCGARRRREDQRVYGDKVDVNAFLQRPLVARVATSGPTLRPLWYLYDEPTFYWLTDTSNVLHRLVVAGEKLVLVIDVCDITTGEVVHVRARGVAEVIPVDRERAMRKFARYLGEDRSKWDPRFVPSLDLPSRRMCRFTPTSIDAADVSFTVQSR